MKNGALIAATEQAAFEVFVTTDQNLRFQQNLSGRRIAVIVILTTSWPRIRADLAPVLAAIDSATSGAYVEVAVAMRKRAKHLPEWTG